MGIFKRLGRKLGIRLKLRDPPQLPTHGWAYFDHMVAVYVTLNSADRRADDVIRKARETPDLLTWADVFLIENVIFSLQPPEILGRSAWILRERLRLTACSDVYAKYLESSPPDEDVSTPEKLKVLRADLTRVLDLLHWHYSLLPIWENVRQSLTVNCIWLTVTYTVALTFCLFVFHKHRWGFASMLLCVIYCGVIGGFVSSQRRMQNISSDREPLISIFGLDNAGYFLWLSPLLGSIFAIVLTAMFMGGILKGTIFPEFVSIGTDVGPRFFHFIANIVPKGSEDYAKLFVWAFLAGFAERLVPDSLDRLMKMGTPKVPVSAPSAASAAGLSRMPVVAPLPIPTVPVAEETVDNALHTGIDPVDLPGESASS